MGMVLEAEDIRLKGRVALKVMKPEVAKKELNRQRFVARSRGLPRSSTITSFLSSRSARKMASPLSPCRF